MNRRNFLTALAASASLSALFQGCITGRKKPNLVSSLPATANFVSIKDFGASGNGAQLDTPFIQQAIDSANQNGGGTVYFPAGVYLSGSIRLKSNVTLYLENGATLLASPNDDDFDPYEKLDFKNDSDEETSYFHFSLIWGQDAEHIAILGQGTIDSNRRTREGPKTIGLKRCKYITIKDVTIRNAGNYAVSMLGTDYVNIDGVSIFATYADGIDPDNCHNVRISNCYIESWDDAICLKASYALGYRRSTENVTVTNCVIATASNAFKLGTESAGDFKHITVSNCAMTVYRSKVNYRVPTKPISGITLISADGAHLENLTITNIVMDKVRYPFFLRLANRGRDQETATPVPGTMKNVVISNITISEALIAGMIVGQPDRPIENLVMDNIKISLKGNNAKGQPNLSTIPRHEFPEADVKEAMKKYPSANKFSRVPTYGLYTRHVKGLVLENIQTTTETTDDRHALYLHDVEDVSIRRFKTTAGNLASQLYFYNVRNGRITNCQPETGDESFLKVSGARSREIYLVNNFFNKLNENRIYSIGQDADRNSVILENNIRKK